MVGFPDADHMFDIITVSVEIEEPDMIEYLSPVDLPSSIDSEMHSQYPHVHLMSCEDVFVTILKIELLYFNNMKNKKMDIHKECTQNGADTYETLSSIFNQCADDRDKTILSVNKLNQFMSTHTHKHTILSNTDYTIVCIVMNKCNVHKPVHINRHTFIRHLCIHDHIQDISSVYYDNNHDLNDDTIRMLFNKDGGKKGDDIIKGLNSILRDNPMKGNNNNNERSVSNIVLHNNNKINLQDDSYVENDDKIYDRNDILLRDNLKNNLHVINNNNMSNSIVRLRFDHLQDDGADDDFVYQQKFEFHAQNPAPQARLGEGERQLDILNESSFMNYNEISMDNNKNGSGMFNDMNDRPKVDSNIKQHLMKYQYDF